MKWYWFTARKDGEDRRERIPAENGNIAISELQRLGYANVKIFDEQPMHQHYTYAKAF